MLKSHFLLGKMQETMAKLLTERSNEFERQRSAMMRHMQEETTLHQNAMDQVESVVEKVGTTLDQFTSSLTTLSSTIKGLSADQRSQGTPDWCFERNPPWDSRFQKSPGPYPHHEQRNEERSLASKWASVWFGWWKGTVLAQKGSLLYVIVRTWKRLPNRRLMC